MKSGRYVWNGKTWVAAADKPARRDVPGGTRPDTWPKVGKIALNVNPEQLDEVRARNKREGVNVDYTPEGNPVIPDAAAYKRLMKVEGVTDRDSFY